MTLLCGRNRTWHAPCNRKSIREGTKRIINRKSESDRSFYVCARYYSSCDIIICLSLNIFIRMYVSPVETQITVISDSALTHTDRS